jgi:hypothetical protein
MSQETWNNPVNENDDKMLKNFHKTYIRFFTGLLPKRKHWFKKKRKYMDD